MAKYKGLLTLFMPAVLFLANLFSLNIPGNSPSFQPPITNDDNYGMNINSQLVISAPGVLFNDIFSPSNDRIAIKLSEPKHGLLNFSADGSFSYSPEYNFIGTDTFTYKLNDGHSDSNAATVLLTIYPLDVVPQQPIEPLTTPDNFSDGSPLLFGITVTPFSPVNGASDVATSPTLSAHVSDANNDTLQVSFYGRQKTSTAVQNFTLVGIPDTQYYTINTGGYVYFNAMTTWMANNQTAQNLVFVTHTGDITQNGDNDTDDSEWTIADTAMSILERDQANPMDDVPYSISPGNHESNGSVGGVLARYDAHFPISRFSGKPYYGGHYGTNNDNSYSLFTVSGMHFIIINLACTNYDPTTAVLNWADGLLKDDVSRRGIVVCHDAMDANGAFQSAGQKVFNALSDNPNWFLLLCGHAGIARREDTGSDGHKIYSFEADYSGYANGGNSYMRLMQFQPDNGQIYVKTFSPMLNGGAGGYATDPGSQFSVPYTMLSPDFTLLGSVTVPSGSDASFTWSGLANSTEYEWYAVARNTSNNSVGDVQSFTTTANPSGTETPTPTSTPGSATATPTSTPYSASATPSPSSTATATSTGTIRPSTATPTPTATQANPPFAAFADTFDPVSESWTHFAALGSDDWGLSTAYSHSPGNSYFCSEPATIKDDYLLTRPILIPANAVLSFWHTYKIETGYDGAVIEISTDGGATFTDLGSLITAGIYNGTIASGWGNPIAGRPAWTGGTIGVWSQVSVDLSVYAGQAAIIRFRMTSDNGTAKLGWYIDDVSIIGSAVTSTPTSTQTVQPTYTPTPSATATPPSTATSTPTPTPTQTMTPTPTASSTPTALPTSTATSSPSATNSFTSTPTASSTPTLIPTATNTPLPTSTHTMTFTPTASSTTTPVPTSTNTPVPTATSTVTFTPTATNTKTATSLPTNTRTPTATRTVKPTRTSVSTRTATASYTPTATFTPSPTLLYPPVFADNFDPSTALWNHTARTGLDDWKLSTAQAHSLVTSYYCSEPATVKDDYLLTHAIVVPTNAVLSFWHTYQMEAGRDGAIIEISTDNESTFADLGSLITAGKYNGTISNRYASPIGGHQAWTGGTLGAWSQVVVDLSSYAGKSVIIRFRLASDNRRGGYGWYIDDVMLYGQ